MSINGLLGKLIINGEIKVLTGLHIGGSSDFSAIGSVDSVVVRDPVSKEPYIPGSSLKGKMRYLLARVFAKDGILSKVENEVPQLKRLFGSSAKDIYFSRLQFFDMFMTRESVEKINRMDTDLYLSEIKFENTINRVSAVANPRQIERVPAGAVFEFKLVYNVESLTEAEEDLNLTGYGLSLIEDDYIGGSGSRGYGRIKFSGLDKDSAYTFKDYTKAMESILPAMKFDVKQLITAFKNGREGVL